jgi:hypothetical protein
MAARDDVRRAGKFARDGGAEEAARAGYKHPRARHRQSSAAEGAGHAAHHRHLLFGGKLTVNR